MVTLAASRRVGAALASFLAGAAIFFIAGAGVPPLVQAARRLPSNLW